MAGSTAKKPSLEKIEPQVFGGYDSTRWSTEGPTAESAADRSLREWLAAFVADYEHEGQWACVPVEPATIRVARSTARRLRLAAKRNHPGVGFQARTAIAQLDPRTTTGMAGHQQLHEVWARVEAAEPPPDPAWTEQALQARNAWIQPGGVSGSDFR